MLRTDKFDLKPQKLIAGFLKYFSLRYKKWLLFLTTQALLTIASPKKSPKYLLNTPHCGVAFQKIYGLHAQYLTKNVSFFNRISKKWEVFTFHSTESATFVSSHIG